MHMHKNEQRQDWDTDMQCTNKGMLMYIACLDLCPNLVSVYYAIPTCAHIHEGCG